MKKKRLDISLNPKTYEKTKKIEGYIVEAKVGNYIVPDGWSPLGQCLTSSTWEKADYYLPTGHNYGVREIATNIYISGRTFVYRTDGTYVRVQIEFVGDGEPSTYTYGYMQIGKFEVA